MGDFLFIRVVFFAFFFVGITLAILIIELVGRMLVRLKTYWSRFMVSLPDFCRY